MIDLLKKKLEINKQARNDQNQWTVGTASLHQAVQPDLTLCPRLDPTVQKFSNQIDSINLSSATRTNDWEGCYVPTGYYSLLMPLTNLIDPSSVLGRLSSAFSSLVIGYLLKSKLHMTIKRGKANLTCQHCKKKNTSEHYAHLHLP